MAAQITALGLVFNVVSEGAMSQPTGMIVGAVDRAVYTIWGGMWSVAITDFLQMIIIVIGMLYIGWDVSGIAGGVGTVVSHASTPASSPRSGPRSTRGRCSASPPPGSP